MKYGYLFVLLAAVLYGLGGILIRPVTGSPQELGEVSSLAVGAIRSIIALSFFLLVLNPIDGLIQRRSLFKVSINVRSQWVWYSAVSRAVNTLSFATAIVFCSIATGYLLCNMTIVGMLLWSYLIDGKRPKGWQLSTAFVVIASCLAHFYGDPHHVTVVGGLAGVLGLLSFSGFFFFNAKIARDNGPQDIQGAVMLSHILTPVFAIVGIAVCAAVTPISLDAESWARLWQPIGTPSLYAVGLLILLGIFQGGLADWLVGHGQARKPDLLFMAFVPTLIMLWASALAKWTLNERMFGAFYGIPFIVVHAAILYGSMRNARESKQRLALAKAA